MPRFWAFLFWKLMSHWAKCEVDFTLVNLHAGALAHFSPTFKFETPESPLVLRGPVH